MDRRMNKLEYTIRKLGEGLFFLILYFGISFLSVYLCINWNFAEEYSGGIGWFIAIIISFNIVQYYRYRAFKARYILYSFLLLLILFCTSWLWQHNYIIANIIICWLFFCDF